LKRILLVVVGAGILGAGLLVFLLITSLDALVEGAIEQYGSEMTGTRVQVASVQIDLAEGSATILGLTIANPAGFETPEAFRLEEITVDIDTGRLTGSPIGIDHIEIQAPEVTYELNAQARSNLEVIADNLDRYAGESASEPTDPTVPTEPSGSSDDPAAETRLAIDAFVFEKGNVAAHTSAVGGKDATLKLPPLRMNKLGGAKGMTGAELGSYALNAYIRQVLKAVGKSQLGGLIDKELGGAEGEAAKQLLNKLLD
jgi:hypothetical protein